MTCPYCPYCGPFQRCQNPDDCVVETDQDAEDRAVMQRDFERDIYARADAEDAEPSEAELERTASNVGVPLWERV